MTETQPRILLITPVWNDSARLAGYGREMAEALAGRGLPVRWIIADDGSAAAEHGRLLALRDEFAAIYRHVEVHFAAVHHGKGSVVREAWALDPQADWLAFVDADGSAPAEDFLHLVEAALAAGTSVLGVRVRTATTEVVESVWRGIAHRSFLLAVHWVLGLRCADPQCGAKVLHGADYRRIAPRLVENGLAFDSELLAVLHRSGARWSEVPINWREKKGGKVHPLVHGWGMLAALWRVRRRLR